MNIKRLLIVIPFLILIGILILFHQTFFHQPIVGRNIDLIEHINKAKHNIIIDESTSYITSPDDRVLIDGGYLIPIFRKLDKQRKYFKTHTKNRYISNGMFKVPIATVFNNHEGISLYFRKKDSSNYHQIILDFKDKLTIELKIQREKHFESKKWIFQKADLTLRNGTLYVLYSDHKILLINNNSVLLYSTGLNRTEGFIEIVKLNGNQNTNSVQLRNIKHVELTSDLQHKVNDLINTCGFEYGYITANANQYFPEHRIKIKGSEYPFVQRVEFNNRTMRSLLIPAGSEIKWNVKIPRDARFEFSRAFSQKHFHKKQNIKYVISISPVKSSNKEKFEINVDTLKSRWIDESIPLEKYAGIECDITLSVKTDKSLVTDFSLYAIWGNPIITSPRTKGEKNILVILLDTLRPDHLGCYGYNRETSPNIDNFAKSGVVFENAISSSPWTLPSHMSIFTSRYPTETGFFQDSSMSQMSRSESTNYYLKNSRILTESETLTEALKIAGYRTLAFTGGAFVSPVFYFDRGFEQYSEAGDFMNALDRKDISREIQPVIDWIQNNSDRKFFIFFHTYEIHFPYKRNLFTVPDLSNEGDKIIAKYDSGIKYADEHTGRLLKTLKQEGLMKNTLIVILSDHGENFSDSAIKMGQNKSGFHGATLYDSELRVPLIIGGLKSIKSEKRIESQVRTIDVMPTILDILGIEMKADMRGKSLKKLLSDQGDISKDQIAFSEAVYLDEDTNIKRAIRTGEHKLIKNLYYSMSSKHGVKNKYEFYNIRKDAEESNDISTTETKTSLKLKKLLKSLFLELKKKQSKLNKKHHPGKSGMHDDLLKQLADLGYINSY